MFAQPNDFYPKGYRTKSIAQRARYSGSVISGPYHSYFVTDRAEEFSVMGGHFRPGSGFPLLGVSALELVDRHLDLAAVWGRGVRISAFSGGEVSDP